MVTLRTNATPSTSAITKLNKNGNNVKWYNDGGMLTIGYKFELK